VRTNAIANIKRKYWRGIRTRSAKRLRPAWRDALAQRGGDRWLPSVRKICCIRLVSCRSCAPRLFMDVDGSYQARTEINHAELLVSLHVVIVGHPPIVPLTIPCCPGASGIRRQRDLSDRSCFLATSPAGVVTRRAVRDRNWTMIWLSPRFRDRPITAQGHFQRGIRHRRWLQSRWPCEQSAYAGLMST